MKQPALCLAWILVAVSSLHAWEAASQGSSSCSGSGRPPDKQGTEATGSVYAAASTAGEPVLKTGQEADILLSGVDFDNAGGPLLFNHNGGISSDGRRLLLCDRNNNRVLVWTSLPGGNTPPDLVLGQPDFVRNNPGTGRNQMNWPIAVHTDGTRVLVADAYNDRILIWNTFPTRNGQPADLVLQSAPPQPPAANPRTQWGWPWGVWSDGTRVVVTGTGSSAVLIWNSFPVRDDQPADLRLTGGGKLGTPRGVITDGKSLIVGDHNARAAAGQPGTLFGNWVWKTFPTTEDALPDYFLQDPCDNNAGQMNGEFLADGRLALIGKGLYFWNSVPASATTPPALTVDWPFFGGDGSDITEAGTRLYISTANANRIAVYEAPPVSATQAPGVAIGSPDLATNTLDTAFIISNPVPASNGKNLFVTSDFDRRLYIWKSLPGESGAHPDFVTHLQEGPWDIALHGETLAVAGARAASIWKTLPLDGRAPDVTFQGKVGSQTFQRFSGVALDATNLYLSDPDAGKIHVFRGIPGATDSPALSLDLPGAMRLDSDGTWLVATCTTQPERQVVIYRISDLRSGSQGQALPTTAVRVNLPQYATVYAGRLFVGDTNFNRVLSWNRVEDALAGKAPDLVLGAEDLAPQPPRIGKKTLFWPGAPVFDGRYLWVGEFKFSERLLRFGGGGVAEPALDTVRFVPAAASASGAAGAQWLTTLTILNPDRSKGRMVKLSFLPAGRDNRTVPETTVEIPAGRAVVLKDVVGETLGQSGSGGLRLRADGDLLASSRTQDVSAGAGAVTGVDVEALSTSAALSSGLIFPLRNQPGDTGVRTNVGFLNPSEEAVVVEAELLDFVSGTSLGTTRIELPPLGFAQVSNVFEALGHAAAFDAGGLKFVSTRPVFGFGIVLENASNTGRWVPASSTVLPPHAGGSRSWR